MACMLARSTIKRPKRSWPSFGSGRTGPARSSACTRATSSALSNGFPRYPSAPIRSPTTRSGGSSFADRKSTGTSELRRSWRQRLIPSTLGMSTSSVTRSGRNALNASIACRASVITRTSWPASSRTVCTSSATSRSSSTTRILPPRVSGAPRIAASWSITLVARAGKRRAMCNAERPPGRSREGGVHRGKLPNDPVGPTADLVRPGLEEEPVGLVFDPLAQSRPARCGSERVGLHPPVGPQAGQRGDDVRGPLMREELGERVGVGGLVPPDAGQHLEVGTGQPGAAPRGHVTVVPHPQEPTYGHVELGERAVRGSLAAIDEGPRRAYARGRFLRVRSGLKSRVEKTRELRKLIPWERFERGVVLALGRALPARKIGAFRREVPAAASLLRETGAARRRGPREPAIGDRPVHAVEIGGPAQRAPPAPRGEAEG